MIGLPTLHWATLMNWTTLAAIMAAPLMAWAVSSFVNAIVRFVWRRLPQGRLKRLLFARVPGLDYREGWKAWDQ